MIKAFHYICTFRYTNGKSFDKDALMPLIRMPDNRKIIPAFQLHSR